MNTVKLRKIEVLVVMVTVFVGLFCVYAAAFRSREQAKRLVCASYIRQNCQSIIDYAADHDGAVTFNTTGWWINNISFSGTDDLIHYGSTRQGFYCPTNKVNTFDIRYWQFSRIPYYPLPNYYTDFDESMLSPAQKESYYRVITYSILTARPDFTVAPDLISDLDEVANPQEREMVIDQIMSQYGSSRFYEITAGGLTSMFGIAEQSNHLNKSGYPFGGNIGFADGHVAWRSFDQMQIRLQTGLYFWW